MTSYDSSSNRTTSSNFALTVLCNTCQVNMLKWSRECKKIIVNDMAGFATFLFALEIKVKSEIKDTQNGLCVSNILEIDEL